jgi:hypothetical protein
MTLLHRPWEDMKRCVLNADGSVNYYLNPADSTLKEAGGAADLSGADGNVMVEIPKFYFRYTRVGDVNTWSLRTEPLSGYTLHPAFVKAGVEVDYRYIGAYDACVYDDSASAYIAGLNLDNNSSNVDTAADKLASVSGIYPMVGLTRNQNRLLAANVGTGWHQLDFALWSAVQMLYLVEYADFNSQANLGAGNTNGGYFASSADQNDSPHTIAGASNSLGNASTDATTGAGVSAKPGTSFMSYRGIENWYGNCWTWADGINVNVAATGNVHVTNDYRDFADGTAAGHELVTSAFPTASGFIRDLLNTGAYFLSSSNSGASSTTFITDQHFASASASRVVLVGGSASDGAFAGGFYLASSNAASSANRALGARLCR